jgi:hypothetical protein
LVGFVLKKRGYWSKMMATASGEFWIAPSLASGTSLKEAPENRR